MLHRGAAPQHRCIGHQPPVAPPPQGLSTHDRDLPFACELPQVRECRGECWSLHVVRVASERRMSQGPIGRRRAGLPETPEGRFPGVGDPRLRQPQGHLSLGELRIVPTSRYRPDVDQVGHACPVQQRCELLGRCGPVTHGQEPRLQGALDSWSGQARRSIGRERRGILSCHSELGRWRYMVWMPTRPGPRKRLKISSPTPAKRPVRRP